MIPISVSLAETLILKTLIAVTFILRTPAFLLPNLEVLEKRKGN
jgi:hypothetical protein